MMIFAKSETEVITMDDFDAQTIGKCIKEGLALKRMKQKELAQIMGKSNALISEWISGRKIPRGDDLIRVVKKLEIVHLIFPETAVEHEGDKTKKLKQLQLQMDSMQKKFEFFARENNLPVVEGDKTRRLKQLQNQIDSMREKFDFMERKVIK